VGYVGCIISSQLVRKRNIGRRDQNGLGRDGKWTSVSPWAEAAKIGEFAALFKQHGLSDRVVLPTVVKELSSENVLVMGRVRGVKLLSVLNSARAKRRRPKCPAAVAAGAYTRPLFSST
jgi:hypothetical protein